MTVMREIEAATRAYAEARDALAEVVRDLERTIEDARRTAMPAVKRRVAEATKRKEILEALIVAHPGLFERPRTVTIDGIRVGYMKGKGDVAFDLAPDVVVRLIRKHLPDQADALIKTTEVPVKSALANLTAPELKRIGVSITGAGDRVMVKPVDGEVDKLVAKLLESAAKPEEDER